jgi:hypothetical protein
MDRRALFFLGAAAVCAALVLPSDPDLRWVPTVLAITYLVLAALSFLDYRSRRASTDPSPDIEA